MAAAAAAAVVVEEKVRPLLDRLPQRRGWTTQLASCARQTALTSAIAKRTRVPQKRRMPSGSMWRRRPPRRRNVWPTPRTS
jgi:hypothetical protein